MASIKSLANDLPVVQLLNPAADAAGRTGGIYVSLKNAHKAWIICHVTQGNAATVQFSPVQGTSAAGASSKAITACPIWSNLDESASDALTSQTAATSYTTDAAVKNKIVIFQIDPAAHLDTANSFYYVGLTTGASNAANITQAIIILETRWPGNAPPTAIT